MAEQAWNDRPGTQFPFKYGQLPSIPSNSPQPSVDTQIIPYNSASKSHIGAMPAITDFVDYDDRMRQLEMRLNVTEKSNRALLEEIVRLQTDIKTSTRKNDDILREERYARQQQESVIRASNDLIMQLATRLKSNEEKLQEERITLSSLVNHTKSVEQAVLGSQQELLSRKDVHGSRIKDLRSDLDETLQSKEQMERMIYNLVDDMRQLKTKVNNNMSEFSSLGNEVMQRSKRVEEDNRITLETFKKQGDIQNITEQNTSLLREQVENRLSELRNVLVELRNQQDQETQDRRMLEQHLQQKTSDLQTAIAEQNRKREESIHALDVIQREKEHASDTDKLRLQSKINENLEEFNKKLLTKEIKLREEIQDKYIQLEKTIQHEQSSRHDYEKTLREDNEKRWQSVQRLSDEEVFSLRDIMKMDKSKTKETLQKLDQGVNILEQQVESNKKQTEKIIAAEIKSRKIHERNTNEKIGDVQEKLQVATSTLQQAIGGVNGNLSSYQDKIHKEMKAVLDEATQANTRMLADLEARMQLMKEKIGNLDQMQDAKISAASAAMAQNIREKLESISLWREVTSQSIRELENKVQALPNDIYAVKEKHELLKSEVESRVSAEADARIRAINALDAQILALNSRPRDDAPKASQKDLENVQTSVRKLAESIQTVKTVLGMKIQSEQKLRVEEIKSIQDEVILLRSLIEPLVKNKPEAKLFVKDPNVDPKTDENNAEDINKWDVHNAYKWLTWKQKWLYLKWKRDSKPQSPTPKPGPSNSPKPATPAKTPSPKPDSPKNPASPKPNPPSNPASPKPNTPSKPVSPKPNSPTGQQSPNNEPKALNDW